MADNNGTDPNGQAAQNSQQNQQGTTPTPAAPAFDYEKLAGILEGRQKANEESVLKGYFKDQGITGDEAAQAIANFKAQKAANTPNPEALKQQAAQAQAQALRLDLENKALLMAGELGVDLKTMPYVFKMADLKEAVANGKVDDEKLKTAISKVLEDIPQLKAAVSTDDGKNGAGIRVGADTGSTTGGAGQDKLRAAFGLK